MRTLRSKLTLVGAAAAVAVTLGLFGLSTASATAPTPGLFTSTSLVGPVLFGEIKTKSNTNGHKVKLQTKGDSDVFVTHIRIQPGGDGGWHSHPGPSIIAVKAGVATFYDDCDGANTPHRYAAGTGFVEDSGCVHILKNEGTVDVEIYVTQIVPRGAMRRIDEADPR
jgi:quercetin dioxygenase-like cupin family protein